MSTITWNTEVNASCPGKILHEDGRSYLVQTYWDYPGVAGSFGWSTRCVQRCLACKHVQTLAAGDQLLGTLAVLTCEGCGEEFPLCHHSGTDGTVECPECLCPGTVFIGEAGSWLRANDGATAEDPGYFEDNS